MWFAKKGHFDVVELIVNKQSQIFVINLNDQNVSGMTPFNYSLQTQVKRCFFFWDVSGFFNVQNQYLIRDSTAAGKIDLGQQKKRNSETTHPILLSGLTFLFVCEIPGKSSNQNLYFVSVKLKGVIPFTF